MYISLYYPVHEILTKRFLTGESVSDAAVAVLVALLVAYVIWNPYFVADNEHKPLLSGTHTLEMLAQRFLTGESVNDAAVAVPVALLVAYAIWNPYFVADTEHKPLLSGPHTLEILTKRFLTGESVSDAAVAVLVALLVRPFFNYTPL